MPTRTLNSNARPELLNPKFVHKTEQNLTSIQFSAYIPINFLLPFVGGPQMNQMNKCPGAFQWPAYSIGSRQGERKPTIVPLGARLGEVEVNRGGI